MTEEEYLRKREAFASSTADKETIELAIKALDEKYRNLKLAMVEDSEVKGEELGD